MRDYYEKRYVDREVKCILHIGEGEYEGNIKSLLENRSLWAEFCASAQFPQKRKEEKEAKYD